MTYKDFTQQLTEELKKRISEGDEIRIRPVRYNNLSEKKGLTILARGENTSPVICLEPFYHQAMQGEPVGEIADSVMELYEERRLKAPLDTSFFLDWEKIRRGLVRRVIGTCRNKEFLKTVPYRQVMDLAVIYYYSMDHFGEKGGAVLVRNEHLKIWGKTCEDLDAAASENMPRLAPPDFKSMREMMSELMHGDIPGDEMQQDVLFVLSNRQKAYGAVYMLDREVLRGIGGTLGRDYYILPSSVHECMIVPVGSGTSPEELKRLVEEVNSTQVEPEEVLTDSVYLYHRDEQALELICP